MTIDEIAEKLKRELSLGQTHPHDDKVIRAALHDAEERGRAEAVVKIEAWANAQTYERGREAGRREERERCAKVAEEGSIYQTPTMVAKEIAANIRRGA